MHVAGFRGTEDGGEQGQEHGVEDGNCLREAIAQAVAGGQRRGLGVRFRVGDGFGIDRGGGHDAHSAAGARVPHFQAGRVAASVGAGFLDHISFEGPPRSNHGADRTNRLRHLLGRAHAAAERQDGKQHDGKHGNGALGGGTPGGNRKAQRGADQRRKRENQGGLRKIATQAAEKIDDSRKRRAWKRAQATELRLGAPE